MRGYIDLTGQVFGRLTVIKRTENPPSKRVWWDCACSCGESTVVRGISLRRQDTKSCGCLSRELCIKRFAEPRRKYANKSAKRAAYYARKKDYYQQKGRDRYAISHEIIAAAKNQPCADCGIQYHPSLMDFDHLNGESKSFTISRKLGRVSPEALRHEISKCDIVCCICHRVRTWNRARPESPISAKPLCI